MLSTWTVKSASLENLSRYKFQQDAFKEITGVVKTEDGEPILGVVVKLAGTNIETVTDAEGRYKFNVKKGDRIQFVFEGFRTVMFTVSQNNVLNIAMVEDDTKMLCMIEDIYRTMVKDRMAHGNNVSSDIIVKRRQDSIFKEIKGIVKTDQGDPIPGAVVLKVGTNQGTDTDEEGKYSLSANEGDKIQFVYEGFKTTTLTVGKSNILNATMVEDDIDLSNVRNNVASKIKSSGFPHHRSEEIIQMLSGHVPLNVVTKAEEKPVSIAPRIECAYPPRRSFIHLLQGQLISIDFSKRYNPSERHPEVILKDAEALTRNGNYTYIIDGVRVSEETFRTLNQNDVESVDIYKHTDVYNARFGNKENQSRLSLNAR